MGKKSISRKMLLPVFLASFCSGANAMENKNVAPAQNMFQGAGVKGNLLGNTKNDSNKGFSGLAMVGTNSFSLIGGGVTGYILGQKMNAPKDPGTPHGPTQQQFDDLKAEKERLEEENKKLKNSNPDAGRITDLENKIQQLTEDLDTAKKYEQIVESFFTEDQKNDINLDQRLKTLRSTVQLSKAFGRRFNDPESCFYESWKELEETMDEIKQGFKAYDGYCPDYMKYLAGTRNFDTEKASSMLSLVADDFELDVQKGKQHLIYRLNMAVNTLMRMCHIMDKGPEALKSISA